MLGIYSQDYWSAALHLFQPKNADMVSSATPDVIQAAIKDIMKRAQEQFNLCSKEDYLKPASITALKSLKHVKAYSIRNQSFLSYCLHQMGIKHDSNIEELSRMIKEAEKNIVEINKKKEALISTFKSDDKHFLQIFSNLIQSKQFQANEQISLEELLGPKDSQFFSNYLNNLNEDKKALLSSLKEMSSNPKLTSLLIPQLDKNIQSKAILALEGLIELRLFASKHPLVSLTERADALLTTIQSGGEPNKENKLNVKEFSLFDILPSLYAEIPLLGFKGIFGATILKEIESLQKMRKVKKEITEIIKEELNDPNAMPSGCFSFHNIFRDYTIHNRKNLGFMGLVQVITSKSKYNHTSIIYKEKEHVKQSHVLGNYVNENVGFYDLAVSEFSALDWKKLIPGDKQKQLESAYGKDWQTQVQIFYDQACLKFHRNSQFENINNQVIYRFESVLKPHFQIFKNDPHSFVFKDRKMFCSQFTAMATIVTLEILNHALIEDLAKKNIACSEKIIQSPFKKRENFAAMHPGRLASILEKYTKPVEPLKIVNQMIDFDKTIKQTRFFK